MRIRAGAAGRRAAVTVFTLATAVAATCAGTATAATGPAVHARGAAAAIVHRVSRAGQDAARAYWTSSRMAAAAPLSAAQPLRDESAATTPDAIPEPTWFNGVPTVGALFFTTGTRAHFCTASVVNSLTANLILTAAHCVYGSAPATNIEFVPEYHHGKQPYGAWPVRSITVAVGWQQSHDPNLDFAFLSVAPPPGTHLPIQFVTGGLWLGINRGYAHPIEVIGYNNTGNAPIRCATNSFKFAPDQMKFYCRDYQDGTSGGPWILGYNGQRGTGTVFGVIGGYAEGGNHAWASYSAYFSWPTLKLYVQAQKQQA